MAEAPAGGQDWSAAAYRRHAAFVPALGAEVLALLDPRPGERILDLGCGDGVLTARIAAAGAEVIGLEPAAEMAAQAERRGLRIWRQDARDPWPERGFDAVFSNAALHWIADPRPVFARAFAALRPGGRFVAEQGGFGNVAAIVTALNAARTARGLGPCMPWDFPSPARQAARLAAAGFAVDEIALIPRPTPLPTGMAGWLETFAGPFVADLAPEDRPDLLARALALLCALHEPGSGWVADYVRLRFRAHRP
ncbi:MAG: class I SAM-dependent methyltransferase [Rhodobacteraceae bacterium]|nr:class I SAM-dependent methyltransferase [Paracoccaceae bacterium]